MARNNIILLSFIMKRLKNITNSLVKSYILFNFAAKIKRDMNYFNLCGIIIRIRLQDGVGSDNAFI